MMTTRSLLRSAALVAALFGSNAALQADVRLPAIISDHMVLQADMAAPIWGWAEAGEKVTVTFAGQTKTATPDKDGRWQVSLDKLTVSAKPQQLTVAGKNTLTVKDVLVGEVWLGSGQSNMAMTVDRSLNFGEERLAAKLPELRMFTVARNPQPEKQLDCKGSWEVCTADTVGKFSATAFFFGRDLQAALKQPIGLINSSYGGTLIEAWTSVPTQSKLPLYAEVDARWAPILATKWDAAAADAKYQKQLAAFKKTVADAKTAGKTPPARGPRKPIDPQFDPNRPGNLFNGMIEPIIPYAFRGAIWYQGESNSARTYANKYAIQLRTMITEWRSRFGHDFPFTWVQLPDYRDPQKLPVEAHSWPVIREQMLQALDTPNTGMAICLGAGEAKDIHPRDKQSVGNRLARWALAKVYHQSNESSGPLPSGHEVSGKEIVVTFTHADGLKAKDGEVKGFAIAGADKKFVWATARIDGNKVIVSSPEVAQPVAVRYAWADNPVWSLVNSAGLPATPFRTDKD
jgi:sialate O-acetylesterase